VNLLSEINLPKRKTIAVNLILSAARRDFHIAVKRKNESGTVRRIFITLKKSKKK